MPARMVHNRHGLMAAAGALTPQVAQACSVCFGDAESPQTAAMNFAILTLLGVTGVVLSGAAALALTIVLRSSANGAPVPGDGEREPPAAPSEPAEWVEHDG